MRGLRGLAVLAVAIGWTSAIECAHSVHERLEAVPRGWTLHREAHNDEPLVLHVSLPDQNVAAFHQRVIDVSTPGHPLYGQHLEGHQVKEFLQPAREAKDAVINWLQDHNITSIFSDDDSVAFRTSVREANRLLKTKFSWFNNPERGETELRTTEYSVPDHLAEHVDFLHPTIKFPTTQRLESTIHLPGKPKKADLSLIPKLPILDRPQPSKACQTLISPLCLLALYNVQYGPKKHVGNKIAYASFLNQSARYLDLALFEEEIAPYAAPHNFTVKTFEGGVNDQNSTKDSVEANLDNQYIIGLTYPSPVTEYITPGCGPLDPDPFEPKGSCSNEPYLRFTKNLLALPNKDLPQTLSFSYGEDEQSWPEKLARKVCNRFAELGARGVSVLFASGDSGPGAICENNAGTKRKFTPSFPASCPFVTSVGGTQFFGPEEASSFAGGGFSEYFKRPSYQDSAVSAFLKILGNKQSKFYNAKGRGIPDVSAQSVNFAVVDKGAPVAVSGTSAATPSFSSIISLLNNARLSIKKKPLGFLNPLLYSHGLKGLTDIVQGGSVGCKNGTKTIANASWNATKGWDPVTGLGTPDFGKLLRIVAPGVKNKGGVVAMNGTLSSGV